MQSRKGPKATLKWALLMEVCNGSLQTVFLNPDANTPGKVGSSIYSIQLEAMKFLAVYATQLCRGVAYLHKKDLVHRDLKLENILVSEMKYMEKYMGTYRGVLMVAITSHAMISSQPIR